MIKLCKIMGGKSWFEGKRVLELGCGHGHVSKMLKNWGAEVLPTDGREWCVEATKYFWPDLDVRLLDQTKPYNLGRFDLVIHWGISYHLPPEHWEYDLMYASSHADTMCYESEVVDSADPNYAQRYEDKGLDKSLTDVGTRLSAASIERCLRDIGCSFRRYDDKDLDNASTRYSWEETGDGVWRLGQRRFWMVYPSSKR